jgi:hypothetical protein
MVTFKVGIFTKRQNIYIHSTHGQVKKHWCITNNPEKVKKWTTR